MSDDFYRAFEDRHRGSRELIKERLTTYQAFLEPLLNMQSAPRAVDFGCGRGEWLEYVSGFGFEAKGVDIDEGMLAGCEEMGLLVEKVAMLECIRSLDGESYEIISAFHVVEHVPFEDLRAFVVEAMRVLKPGGLLIMETPNPENIVVGTRSFYLDPTHQKPIPSELLTFVAEFSGFKRVKTLRLQEPKDLVQKEDITIQELLSGVSPDYAIVAQKEAGPDMLAKFDGAFDKTYGLSLNDLAARSELRVERVEAKASEAEAKASEAEAKASEAEAKASEAEAKASEAEAKASETESKVAEAEMKIIELAQRLELLLNSKSWKVTAPLRKLGSAALGLKNGFLAWVLFKPQSRPHRILKSVLLELKSKTSKSPRFKRIVLAVLKPFPKLKIRLKRIGNYSFYANTPSFGELTDQKNLSPHARQIYADLKAAIEHQKQGEI